MITNLKSFDCKTNSSCKHLGKYTENSMENMHILLLGCEQPFSDLFMNDLSSAGEKLLNKNLRSTRLSYTPNAEITRMVKNMATIPATMYIQIGNGPVEIVIVANVI